MRHHRVTNLCRYITLSMIILLFYFIISIILLSMNTYHYTLVLNVSVNFLFFRILFLL